MIIYEDEYDFWDDIAARYIHKNSNVEPNTSNIIEAAAHYADLMVVERRKRKRLKLPTAATAEDSRVAPQAA